VTNKQTLRQRNISTVVQARLYHRPNLRYACKTGLVLCVLLLVTVTLGEIFLGAEFWDYVADGSTLVLEGIAISIKTRCRIGGP